MSRPIPEYLRLHVEETPPPALSLAAPTEDAAEDALDRLCDSFRLATGWSLLRGGGPAPLQSPEVLWARNLASAGELPNHLAIHRTPGKSTIDLQSDLLPLCDLLDAVADLADQLHNTRQALVEREAELAVGIPLAAHPREPAHFSHRLRAILRGGAAAAEAQAAALYLLDDDTSHLKLRGAWGLPDERLLAPARPLRGAIADLEALTGHAVAIEDVRLLPHWKSPQDFASALCVPVSSSTTPLGTLWVFGDCVRDFTARQTEMLEIVAGRIAAELERQVLLSSASESCDSPRDADQLAQTQDAQLPIGPISIDGWEVAAACHRGRPAGGDFFDWFARDDGALALAVGGALSRRLPATMTAQLIRGAAKSALLANMPAEKLVRHVADVLWTSTPGDEHAALASVVLTEKSDTVEFCSAGPLGAIIVRPIRPTSIWQAAVPMGSDPDAIYRGVKHSIQTGEALVLVSDTVRKAVNAEGQQLGEAAIADCLGGQLDAPAEVLADAVIQLWQDHLADSDVTPNGDATVLVARRTIV